MQHQSTASWYRADGKWSLQLILRPFTLCEYCERRGELADVSITSPVSQFSELTNQWAATDNVNWSFLNNFMFVVTQCKKTYRKLFFLSVFEHITQKPVSCWGLHLIVTIPGDSRWGRSVGSGGDGGGSGVRWHRRATWRAGGCTTAWTRRSRGGPTLWGGAGHGRPAGGDRGTLWRWSDTSYLWNRLVTPRYLRPEGIPVTCSQESSTGGGIDVVMVEVLMSPMMWRPSRRAWYILNISSRCVAWAREWERDMRRGTLTTDSMFLLKK